MSFFHSDVCRSPWLVKAAPSTEVSTSIRSRTWPLSASHPGEPKRCARNAPAVRSWPRSTRKSTFDPDDQHWPSQYAKLPVTGDPTTPSVRIVVFVAGADDWKPEGPRENVYGCLSAKLVPIVCFR